MDIKIIKNTDKSDFSPIDNNLLLQVMDDNYKFMDYTGKKLCILNVLTNELFEIERQTKKFLLAEITCIGNLNHCVFFTSAEQTAQNRVVVTVHRYMIYEAVCEVIYSTEVAADIFNGTDKVFNIFALDSNYLLIERICPDGGYTDIVFYDIVAGKNIDIGNTDIGRFGIQRMVPLQGNMGAILYGSDKEGRTVGIVNVKQMISELVLDNSNITVDCLDTFPAGQDVRYLKVSNDRIIYSGGNSSLSSEEIIIYDYIKNIKKVRINGYNSEADSFNYIFVLDDIPYYLYKNENETAVINLDTQKVELKFPKGLCFKFLKDDILVTQRLKKRLFVGESVKYIEVYRFPHMHHCIFRTRAEYNGCVACDEELFIITN